MHIIGEIPHSKFKITIFKMNHKLALKIEDEGLEQWYKFRDGVFENGVDDMKKLLDKSFMDRAIKVFAAMQENKIELLREDESEDSFAEII